MPASFKIERITPAQIIILGFLAIILVGTVLLMLPFATVDGEGATFLTALFTSTSATCVTGLVLHDTAMYWTMFGKVVILALIQVGGLGFVTMAIAVAAFSGRRIGLKQRWVMQESISAPQVGGIVRVTGFILRTAFLIEAAGAVLLAFRFVPQMGLLKGCWYAVFHSISAFCNAGFDLMGTPGAPCVSLMGYMSDPVVVFPISVLIVVGGIGFNTWHDLKEHGLRFSHYRLQSKLILSVTGSLLVLAFLYFFCYEFSQPQWADMTLYERFMAAFFQAVTPRTAGFNTTDLAAMTESSQMVTILLMLTGGSPGSTAGGFKTTTLAMLLLCVRAVFVRRESAHCYGRRIPDDVLHSACAIFMLYLMLFFAGGIVISCVDGFPLIEALFEAASAIGTVGLSLGITSQLSGVSQVIIIMLMYFGRVGGLTMIYAVTSNAPKFSKFPQERVTVG